MSSPGQPQSPRSADGPAEPSLALEGVRFGYEPAAAVIDGVSATMPAGRVTALIGPDAAGKSTLLKLMLGHFEPWEGRVTLAGESLSEMPPRRRAQRISYVPQGGTVSFAFTVREVVAMGRFAGGADAAAVARALRRCDLEAVADRPFAHLSGGQQQRVVIARALAQASGSGRVLLADEPGSHMDLWHVHHTMQLLRALAASGLGVLVVIHDLNLAGRYADRVWLMDRGRLIAEGPWSDVLTPERLEPVYGVSLTDMADQPGQRPVFRVEPTDTIDADMLAENNAASHTNLGGLPSKGTDPCNLKS